MSEESKIDNGPTCDLSDVEPGMSFTQKFTLEVIEKFSEENKGDNEWSADCNKLGNVWWCRFYGGKERFLIRFKA